MARPTKQTVDYFPHDANASSGDTLTILQRRWGNDGYAFWFKLLERLCSTDGHFIDCRNPVKWELLLAITGFPPVDSEELMSLLADIEAIDKELWVNSRIIWCQKLIDNLAGVYTNRRCEVPQKPVSTDNNLVSTPNNPAKGELSALTTAHNRQSKVNKSKVNNSKLNNTPLPPKELATGVVVDNSGITDFVDTETGEIISGATNNPPILNNFPEPPVVQMAGESFGKICRHYEANIGQITPLIADGIRDWADNFPSEWIIEAIREAVLAGVRKANYINSILENWNVNGFKAKPKNKADPPSNENPQDRYKNQRFDHMVMR